VVSIVTSLLVPTLVYVPEIQADVHPEEEEEKYVIDKLTINNNINFAQPQGNARLGLKIKIINMLLVYLKIVR